MSTKQTVQPNLSLLDMSIDDIDDLPGFAVPPNGVYSLKFSTTIKVVNDKTSVEASFEIIEVLELNEPPRMDETLYLATKPGTKFSTLFQVENETAMGKLKAMTLPIAAHFGERNMLKLITDTCAVAANLIITATVKQRNGKKGTDQEERIFADISNIIVA